MDMIKIVIRTILLFLVAILIANCGSTLGSSNLSPTETQNSNTPPAAGYGALSGFLTSNTNHERVGLVSIYLAEKMLLNSGPEYTFTFSENSSPKAVVNKTGEFYINDITPGSYFIVMMTLAGSYPILDKNGEHIEVTISPDTILNLKDTFVNWP